jgi:3-dehydroquinate synthase
VSEPPRTVRVELAERAYEIQIGTGLLVGCESLVRQAAGRFSHAVLIADANLLTLAQQISSEWTAANIRCDVLEVAPGEASKSLETAAMLWNQLLAQGANRTSLVVAIGGGVVGDLAGFVAASYARGLRFCQIPTTLLAQVDSSVGGKTGINLPAAKNMVGAFWQPVCVLIDTQVLDTLPQREYASGLAEVVKYGVILDAQLFELLELHAAEILARDPATLRDVIARCCRLKADVVEADERETTGRRAVLNYGHTFAHALETVAGYGTLLHGEAVAIGMDCAARLAEQLGRVPRGLADRQRRLLEALALPTQLPDVSDEALWQAMARDKKVEHGRLRFVLPTRLGHVELVHGIDFAQVSQVLTACRRG